MKSSFENDPFHITGERSKFGFHVEQKVIVTGEGVFHGQISPVIGFTENGVMLTVTGPPNEPSSEWPFESSELELYIDPRLN